MELRTPESGGLKVQTHICMNHCGAKPASSVHLPAILCLASTVFPLTFSNEVENWHGQFNLTMLPLPEHLTKPRYYLAISCKIYILKSLAKYLGLFLSMQQQTFLPARTKHNAKATSRRVYRTGQIGLLACPSLSV